MATISSHVLNTTTGKPAAGVPVTLSVGTPSPTGAPDAIAWDQVGDAVATNADGRLAKPFVMHRENGAATLLRLRFATDSLSVFYPYVDIVFRMDEDAKHVHIPLLLSPYSYSTYRGS
ncbi:hypothetical protein HDU98_010318 [Podochytrium sp. JEL0797]|nr:hypothetical protein HDU98_010318 [Podochytrium sp. JEL0797]